MSEEQTPERTCNKKKKSENQSLIKFTQEVFFRAHLFKFSGERSDDLTI